MKKILVVEDNKNNRYLMRFILEKNGFQVIEAYTGKQGIQIALRDKPDLIIMDIQLPDINGLEATKKIRASASAGKVPIIALTSYAMVGDRERALEAGCTDYIEKPLNPETIADEIKKYI
jgi:two-component system cell cycle response regulator DivK